MAVSSKKRTKSSNKLEGSRTKHKDGFWLELLYHGAGWMGEAPVLVNVYSFCRV